MHPWAVILLVPLLSAIATPVSAQAQQGDPEAASEPADPATETASANKDEDFLPTAPARQNRLAFGIGLGIATTSMDGFIADDLARATESQGVTVDGSPEGNVGYSTGVIAKYYIPHYVLAEIGFGVLYSSGSASLSLGGMSNELVSRSLIMEVPILLGGYYPVADRLYVEAAAGPSFGFFARSYWSVEGTGGADDMKAPGGVGVQAKLAASFLASEGFSIGLEGRYRSLKSGDLRELDSGQVITGALLQAPDAGRTYQLDFSGISAAIQAQFLIF